MLGLHWQATGDVSSCKQQTPRGCIGKLMLILLINVDIVNNVDIVTVDIVDIVNHIIIIIF